jgi:sugar phosphate isomerase/epimerase
MIRPASRRQFLQTSGLTAANVLLPGNAVNVRASSENSPNQSRLFPGCCAYSYRKHLASGQMTMEDFILKGVELGVYAIDVTTYWLKSTEPTYLVSLRHFAYKQGMPFSGVAISSNMCQPDATKRVEELKKIKDWVDVTERLGASHLRVFGGEPPPGTGEEQGVQWVVEMMKPACEYAAVKGITIGIEDHGGITAKASTLLEILKRLDSPYAGINLDITNFKENYYPQIEACIPFATHTHIRDLFENHEPVDLDRVFEMFARAGYKGYMSAEYEGTEDPMTGVPKLVEKIKTLCKKYSSA